MIMEIEFLHGKINHEECVRVVLGRNGWETHIDKTDLIKNERGLLRIIRANGNITTVNPDWIAMVCIMPKWMVI